MDHFGIIIWFVYNSKDCRESNIKDILKNGYSSYSSDPVGTLKAYMYHIKEDTFIKAVNIQYLRMARITIGNGPISDNIANATIIEDVPITDYQELVGIYLAR